MNPGTLSEEERYLSAHIADMRVHKPADFAADILAPGRHRL